jgi:hypothetical protein
MKMRTWMLLTGVLALPALAWSQEEPAPQPAATTQASAPEVTTRVAPVVPPTQPKASFDLGSDSVKSIIRDAAESAPAAAHPLTLTESSDVPATIFRAPRRLHHMDCDSFDCVAYSADNEALYTISREQYFGPHGTSGKDGQKEWLSCQSGNDLLTTFERYDKCRGVSIGLPNPRLGNNVQLELPKLRL